MLGSRIVPVFINVRHAFNVGSSTDEVGPIIYDIGYDDARLAELARQGHDAVIGDGDIRGETYFVPFSPTQIKSATANTGQFGPTADIRYSAEPVPPHILELARAHFRKGNSPQDLKADLEARGRGDWYPAIEAEWQKMQGEGQGDGGVAVGSLWRNAKSPITNTFMVHTVLPDGNLDLVGINGKSRGKHFIIDSDELSRRYESVEGTHKDATLDTEKSARLLTRWQNDFKRLDKVVAENQKLLTRTDLTDSQRNGAQRRINGALRGLKQLSKKVAVWERSPRMTHVDAAKKWQKWVTTYQSEATPIQRTEPVPEQEKTEPVHDPYNTGPLLELADSEIEQVNARRHGGTDFREPQEQNLVDKLQSSLWGLTEGTHQDLVSSLEHLFPIGSNVTALIDETLKQGRDNFYHREREHHDATVAALEAGGFGAGLRGRMAYTKVLNSVVTVPLQDAQLVEAGSRPPRRVPKAEFLVRDLAEIYSMMQDDDTRALAERLIEEGGLEFSSDRVGSVPFTVSKRDLDAIINALPVNMKRTADKMVDYINTQGPDIAETAANAGDPIRLNLAKRYYPRMRDRRFTSADDPQERNSPYGVEFLGRSSSASQSRFKSRVASGEAIEIGDPMRTWFAAAPKANRYISHRIPAMWVRNIFADEGLKTTLAANIPNEERWRQKIAEQIDDYELPQPVKDTVVDRMARNIINRLIPSMLAIKPHVNMVQTVSAFAAMGRMTEQEIKWWWNGLVGKTNGKAIPFDEYIDRYDFLFHRYKMMSSSQFGTPFELDESPNVGTSQRNIVRQEVSDKLTSGIRSFDKAAIIKLKNTIESAIREAEPNISKDALMDKTAFRLEELIDQTQAGRDELARASITIQARRSVLAKLLGLFQTEQMKGARNLEHLRLEYLDSPRQWEDKLRYARSVGYILGGNMLLVTAFRWGTRLAFTFLAGLIYSIIKGIPVDEAMKNIARTEFTARRPWPWWVGELIQTGVGVRLPVATTLAIGPALEVAKTAGSAFAVSRQEAAKKLRAAQTPRSTNVLEGTINRLLENEAEFFKLLYQAKTIGNNPEKQKKWWKTVGELSLETAILMASFYGIGLSGLTTMGRDIGAGISGAQEVGEGGVVESRPLPAQQPLPPRGR